MSWWSIEKDLRNKIEDLEKQNASLQSAAEEWQKQHRDLLAKFHEKDNEAKELRRDLGIAIEKEKMTKKQCDEHGDRLCKLGEILMQASAVLE